MAETTPSAIYLGAGAAAADAQMRAWAHRRLDELLTQREELRQIDPSIGPLFQLGNAGNSAAASPEAEQYFRDALGFVTQIIGADIREAVAPTYTVEGPKQRAALARQLELVQSVWPQRSKSVGCFFSPTLWIGDLTQALEMLDEGQVQPIFQRAPGHSYGWREKRFRVLGALWAIHLEKTGQAQSVYAANDQVAAAFGLSTKGRAATIARWRGELAAIVNCRGKGAAGLWSFDAEIGIRIASEPLGRSHDSDALARSLSNIAFGTRMDGSDSLVDAGERYKAHKASINDGQAATKKRGARIKDRGG